MFKNKYRVVQDTYCGFEAQVKFWWFPIYWFQLCKYGRGIGGQHFLQSSQRREVMSSSCRKGCNI